MGASFAPQPSREAIDPEPLVRVLYQLYDARIFQDSRNAGPSGARSIRAPRTIPSEV